MNYVLSQYLPNELIDIIARKVWDLNINEVNRQVKNNIVWVRIDGRSTFFTSNNSNYYECLSENLNNIVLKYGKPNSIIITSINKNY